MTTAAEPQPAGSDDLTRIIDMQMQQFRSTRDTKTRVNIALWTFLALVSGFSQVGDRQSLAKPWLYLFLACLFLLLILHIWWMYDIQQSLIWDKTLWSGLRVHVLTKHGLAIEPTGKLLPLAPDTTSGASKTSQSEAPWHRRARTYVVRWQWVVIETGTTFILVIIASIGALREQVRPRTTAPQVRTIRPRDTTPRAALPDSAQRQSPAEVSAPTTQRGRPADTGSSRSRVHSP